MAVYGEPDPAVTAHLADMALRGHSPATIYARERGLARLGAALPVPLLQATEEQLLEWRRRLRLGPDATVAYVSHARSFYAWAVRRQLLERNPAADLPCPRLGRRLPRPVPEDRIMAAVAGAPRRIRPWLVLAGWAGLRAKEIALLRRENVLDTAASPVLIVASDATKGHGERIVPLCDFALAELRRAGLPARGWVFRRADHQPGPNQPHLISHLANEYLHQAGIPETLHQFRHRFGTGTFDACGDIRVVQELLGHAYPSTTAGYTAYSRRSAMSAVAALASPERRDR